MTPSRIILLLSALLYLAFLLWYGGSGTPLTPEETEAVLARIEANQSAHSAHDGDLLESFRVLASQDDGDEFYMLNLMRYRQKALYPPGAPYDDDAQAAADRYGRAVLPALLARGSHPILMAHYAGPFIPPDASKGTWDQVGIVRYRSRRDMLDMALDLSASGGGEHKWASIEETIVMPVAPIFDFVFVRGFMAVVFGVVGGGLAFGLRRRPA
ncbi:MAG: hypothetical protein NXI30_13820 [bacterium]|nr:hypothetical protein [bacterium]